MLHQIQTKHQPVGQFEDTRFEKIHNITFKSSIKDSSLNCPKLLKLLLSISWSVGNTKQKFSFKIGLISTSSRSFYYF
jgi:hypothetical protein